VNALKKPVPGVAIYNPRLLTRQGLMDSLVAREPLLKRFTSSLRRELGGQPQHHIVVGARGMGKTTLLLRLRYAIEDDPELSPHSLGVVFPEQQYNISSLADFWLNCIDALVDQLEDTEPTAWVAELDHQVAEIRTRSSRDERRRLALDLLCSLANKLDRRLVLLVDNLDRVLERIGHDAEQWALREVLSSEPRLQLIGTTRSSLESQYRHDRAFYDFFRVHTLTPFDEQEALAVLGKLAELGRHPEITQLLERDPARIKTLHRIAGGSPRTLVILASLLAQGTDGDVRTDIERLLDHLTPSYQHRIDTLAVQAQKVLHALAIHWHPATAAELATPDVKVSAVSSQLNRLVRDGLVEKVQLPDTKRYGFQLRERLFNIWWLMRAGRRVRRRLARLIAFLDLMARHEGLQLPSPPQLEGIRAGHWSEAKPWARQFLGDDEAVAQRWPEALALLAEMVTHNFIVEARQLLRATNRHTRWEPLDHALALLESGELAMADRLAPEMRSAVADVLRRIAPGALDLLATP